jgi:lipopolysaccharide biosynthesis glycosyltransferase
LLFSLTGVMLMDSYHWRERRIKQHVEALTLTHPSAMYTSDEMALNLIFRGHLTELRPCYNTFSFTAKYLPEIPRIWHFNTYKPIIHAPLSQFSTWLSLFTMKDQILLKKLENISERLGTSAMLTMKSWDYKET